MKTNVKTNNPTNRSKNLFQIERKLYSAVNPDANLKLLTIVLVAKETKRKMRRSAKVAKIARIDA